MTRRFIITEIQLGILQASEVDPDVKQLLINKILEQQYIGTSEFNITDDSQYILNQNLIGVDREPKKRGRKRKSE